MYIDGIGVTLFILDRHKLTLIKVIQKRDKTVCLQLFADEIIQEYRCTSGLGLHIKLWRLGL